MKAGTIHTSTLSFTDRLSTFSDCESNRVIASSYAAAGFNYRSGLDSIHCDKCGLTLSRFKDETYDAFSLHKTYRPDCQYACSSGTGGGELSSEHDLTEENGTLMTLQQSNGEERVSDHISRSNTSNCLAKYDAHNQTRYSKLLSELSTANASGPSHYQSNMHCEISRKLSFQDQPLPCQLSASNLANKGFHYGGYNEEMVLQIKCAFCNTKISLIEDVCSIPAITKRHYSLKPDCVFLRGNPNPNIPDIYSNSLWEIFGKEEKQPSDSLSALGISNSFAKHPLLAVPDIRISTYLTFPHTYRSNIDLDLLSEAGYFYEGDADSVTCFYCGCESAKWRTGEDVWKRHVRTSPNCQHVLSTKGASFVSDTLQELGEYQPPRVENLIQNVTTRMIRPRWDAPAIRKAIEMGIDRTHLKTVLINRIKKGERDFRYLAEVVQAVNDLKVSPAQLNSKETCKKLPEVVQLSHSYESDCEEDAGSTDEVEVQDNDSPQAENLQEHDPPSPLTQSSQAEPEPRIEISFRDTVTQLTCKICFSGVVGIIFLPCGHLVCCVSCAPAMVDCPICRKTINGTVQAFMP